MKKHILFFLFIAFLAPALSWAQEIKVGDTTIIPDIDVVSVRNLQPIKDGYGHSFSFDEACIIKRDAVITVLHLYEDHLLVRYVNPNRRDSFVLCPSGTIFFVTKKEFAGMAQKYKNISSRYQNEKSITERLLKTR